MKTAILLMAHGSRVSEANDAVHEIAKMVRDFAGYDIVEVSFRENHAPNIQQGIDACVARGAGRILLVPYFLYMGAHVREDLPREMEEARLRHPGVEMAMAGHLGVHKRLAKLVIDRIEEAFGEKGWR
ncbi:MAG: CbiX/SirB N-terminal domain-containing protein [Geobacteraceae bacterium]|jgi:sirohydrochlorin ferrochelatase|nr:CbiX/SirB N-terminal domain-containing protein [Geobacteraceae bacterium]